MIVSWEDFCVRCNSKKATLISHRGKDTIKYSCGSILRISTNGYEPHSEFLQSVRCKWKSLRMRFSVDALAH